MLFTSGIIYGSLPPVFLDSVYTSSSTSVRRSVKPSHTSPSQHCLSASLFFSLDGSSGPRQDRSVQFPVGAGRGGAAGQPAGGLSFVLCHQTGALAGEPSHQRFTTTSSTQFVLSVVFRSVSSWRLLNERMHVTSSQLNVFGMVFRLQSSCCSMGRILM